MNELFEKVNELFENVNELFEKGFNAGLQAGLQRAIELVEKYPASEHGSLKTTPHEAAQQVKDEILKSLTYIKEL